MIPELMRWIVVTATLLMGANNAFSMTTTPHRGCSNDNRPSSSLLRMSWDDNHPQDSNAWKNSVEDYPTTPEDWESILDKKKDGSYWTDLEAPTTVGPGPMAEMDVDVETETRLDALASIQAEEVTFNVREAERADRA